MADNTYDKRKKEDEQVFRQLEIDRLEKIVGEIPEEEEEQFTIVMGDRSFTMEEILAEAREGTEYGNKYLSMQENSRLERLRRK